MKPISSEISGLLNRVAGASSSTGLQPGERGFVTASQEAAARQWLGSKTPAEVDQAILRSLTSELNVSVNVKREYRFPENRPAYQVATSAGISALSRGEVQAAIRKVETAMTPASHEQCETMVAQLQAALARRNTSEAASEIGFDLYVACLRMHPADVSAAAVRSLATEPREKGATAWFPTVPELEGECRALEAQRKAILGGLLAWQPVDPRAADVERLRLEWLDLSEAARVLNNKVGPGPATDTGPRGERIEAANAAQAMADAAKRKWIDAQRDLER